MFDHSLPLFKFLCLICFTATSIADLPDNDYLGCFQDQEKTPLLQGFYLDLPYILTPHLCVKLCKHKGFEYAGLKEKYADFYLLKLSVMLQLILLKFLK